MNEVEQNFEKHQHYFERLKQGEEK